jgi:NMD protein affecting ribosome stability and mRNA decay
VTEGKTILCLKCGGPTEGRFRPVLGRRRMERLCHDCASALSALVQAVGETCQLSLADARFLAWLQTGRWPTRDGRSVGPEDLPAGWHGPECPCCAAFAEEEE